MSTVLHASAEPQVALSQLDVSRRVLLDERYLLVAQSSDRLPRNAEYEVPRRADFPLRDQGSSADEYARLNLGSIEENRPHPDDYVVADVATMKNRAMADADVITYRRATMIGRMKSHVILEVHPTPNGDRLDVPS